MSKKIRLAGIAYESLVNGPGMRRVYFSQGCRHNCEGCFNPDTHDLLEVIQRVSQKTSGEIHL